MAEQHWSCGCMTVEGAVVQQCSAAQQLVNVITVPVREGTICFRDRQEAESKASQKPNNEPNESQAIVASLPEPEQTKEAVSVATEVTQGTPNQEAVPQGEATSGVQG